MNQEYVIPHTHEVASTPETFGQKAKKVVARVAGAAILAAGGAFAVHEAKNEFSHMNIDVDIDSVTGGSQR